MKLDKDSRKLAKQLFRASFTAGRIDEAKVRTIAARMMESKPRHFIGILKDYLRKLRLEADQHHAVIESAQPLDESLRNQVLNDLQSKHGKDVSADFNVVPEMLGGLRIRLGSSVWDGSVRNRLDRLETSLLTS